MDDIQHLIWFCVMKMRAKLRASPTLAQSKIVNHRYEITVSECDGYDPTLDTDSDEPNIRYVLHAKYVTLWRGRLLLPGDEFKCRFCGENHWIKEGTAFVCVHGRVPYAEWLRFLDSVSARLVE